MSKQNVGNIAVYQDDLYIASPTPDDIVNTLKTKYKLNINPDYHLGAKYPNDPGGVRELDLAMRVSPSLNGSKMRSLWTNQMKS